jgi:hypothetical protein
MAKATEAQQTQTEQTPEPAAQFVVKTQPVQTTAETVEFAKPLVLPTDATTAATVDTGEQKQEAKALTQEDIDKIIAARLKQERAKYADYDALKAKLTEIEDAQKSEEQKRQEKLAALEQENQKLAQQNRETAIKAAIVAAASEIGLDTKAAVKLADTSTLADDFSNVDEIVKAIAADYPGLVRRQAAQTTPANPARSTQPPARTDADRMREYFSGGNSTFWSGSGVRFVENDQ